MTLDGLLRPAADSLHPIPDLDYDLEGFADAVEEIGHGHEVHPCSRLRDVADVLCEVAEHPHAVPVAYLWELLVILLNLRSGEVSGTPRVEVKFCNPGRTTCGEGG